MTGTTVVVGASGWIGQAVIARIDGAIAVPARDVLELGAHSAFKTATAGQDSGLTIVNAAGLKSGSYTDLARANAELVSDLVSVTRDQGGRLIQLGSAAEYGLDPSAEWVDDSTPCQPSSDYGKTKFAGTEAAIASGLAVVLRPFNIASNPPQSGSPLEDMVARVRAGVAAGRPVELLSPNTRRDYVTLEFVVDCITWAVEYPCSGVFNLATGIPIRIGDFAEELVSLMGSESPIVDLGTFPPTTISADPAPWRELTGLSSNLDARGLAALVS